MTAVRLTQIDGALPNLALMKLAYWHKARGDTVLVTRRIEPDLYEPEFDTVYGSVLFDFSRDRLDRFKRSWPKAIVGGTGSGSSITVEETIGEYSYERYDYSGYEGFDASIGFTQRGCRFGCKFCVVPKKEGKPRSVNTIADIWRGAPYPKKIHLLDNDFFGQPREEWSARLDEIRLGGFKVCLNQGINVRVIDEEAARALSRVAYSDDQFKSRRLYTAWDNLGDEERFFRGIDTLEEVGIPAKHVMAYMLLGFAKRETWGDIWHRFNRMVARGIQPYPMVFDRSRADLVCFQRWVITGLYRFVPWGDYDRSAKYSESVEAWRADPSPLVRPVATVS